MYCERWSNEAAAVHAGITGDHCDVPVKFPFLLNFNSPLASSLYFQETAAG